jgi:hypothetical protein
VLDHISARMEGALSRGFAALETDPPALPRDQTRSQPG